MCVRVIQSPRCPSVWSAQVSPQGPCLSFRCCAAGHLWSVCLCLMCCVLESLDRWIAAVLKLLFLFCFCMISPACILVSCACALFLLFESIASANLTVSNQASLLATQSCGPRRCVAWVRHHAANRCPTPCSPAYGPGSGLLLAADALLLVV